MSKNEKRPHLDNCQKTPSLNLYDRRQQHIILITAHHGERTRTGYQTIDVKYIFNGRDGRDRGVIFHFAKEKGHKAAGQGTT